MDRAHSIETFVNLYQTIRCHIPEDGYHTMICTYGYKLFVCMTCKRISEKCHGNKYIQTPLEKEGCTTTHLAILSVRMSLVSGNISVLSSVVIV
jgi:hypothetical protein